jgi:uncharacterized protein YkwD
VPRASCHCLALRCTGQYTGRKEPRLLLLVIALASALIAPSTAGAADAHALQALRSVRLSGCGGHAGTRVVLRSSAALDAAASLWSRGTALKSAIDRPGYRADQSAALHVGGTDQALRQALSQRLCGSLTDPAFVDAGTLTRGSDTWIILAAPFSAPAAAAASDVAFDVLRLVNAARARPQRCGRDLLPAAPPLQLNGLLTDAAREHADEMLRLGYFEHTGRDGSTPAERVAATGYHYRLVGENLASGPETPQEVVRGWIASPGHCQNIMDARFSELGVAFAASRSGQARIYWVQEFGEPR